MINYKENGYRPEFDFIQPVTNVGGRPYSFLLADRTSDDYLSDHRFLLPPNFLRSLVSEESLDNLNEGLATVTKKYPGRFEHFDLHLRGLHEDGKLELPWDVLTYIIFDGKEMYTPVNVSFSHTVMTSKWDEDKEKDTELKSRFVESQIMDITTMGGMHGPEISVYGISIPRNFSFGLTDRIFMEYPSKSMFSVPASPWEEERIEAVRSEYKASKRSIIIQSGEEYAVYYFRGKSIKSRKEFESILDDPAFVEYNKVVTGKWNENFKREMDKYNLLGSSYIDEQDKLSLLAKNRILKDLGAIAI